MAHNGLYTLSHVLLDGSETDVVLDQILSHSTSTGINNILASTDGSPYNTFTTHGSFSPQFTFTTSKLATLLNTIGATFHYHIGTSGEGNNVDLKAWFMKMERGGLRATSGHLMLTIAQGVMVPVSIQASNDAIATAEMMVYAYDPNGANNPIVWADGAIVGTLAITECFKVGPAKANGTAINGVLSSRLDFGVKVIAPASDGTPYPNGVWTMSVEPMITLETTDIGICKDIDPQGEAISSNTCIYLRKLTRGGGVVDAATEQHIQITVNDGMISWENPTAQQGQHGTVTVKITPTATSAGGAPLSVDTTAAIA